MVLHVFQRMWDRLTEPPQSIQEAYKRRQAQLLSSLYIVIVPLGCAVVLFQFLLAAPYQRTSLSAIVLLMVTISLVVLIAYFLTRTRYYRLVAGVTIGFATVAVSLAVFLHPSPLNAETLLFYIIPIILAGTFLQFRQAVLCLVINLIVMVLVALVDARLDFRQVLIGPFGLVLVASGILLLSYRYRNLLEQDRQAELSQREARYRGLFETVFEAFSLHNGTTILEHNLGFSRMFGYGAQEQVGMPVLNVVDPKSQDIVNQVLLTGDSKPVEALGLKKDGTTFHIELIAKSHTHNGQKVNVIAIRDISGRKRIEEQLRVSLDEKDVLLKEIHHRVKNNLQVISSLLNLQAVNLQDPILLAQYQDMQTRVRSMALVHERLYRSNDLARIDFGGYLCELASSLTKTYRKPDQDITVQVDTDAILLDIEMAVPCGLLVNELVSNALKHAFPGGRAGAIGVEMRCDSEGQYRLTVYDDGVGIPAGMDYRKTMSLGLQLANSLARQLYATLELANASGTRFEIKFAANMRKKG